MNFVLALEKSLFQVLIFQVFFLRGERSAGGQGQAGRRREIYSLGIHLDLKVVKTIHWDPTIANNEAKMGQVGVTKSILVRPTR